MAERQNISLAPLTPDQAMAAILSVKPADVAKLEAQEGRARAKTPAPARKKRGKA